ncbi:NUDIX domain-containing protein [Campylobacter sp. MG1]|uniref:NUDIX domain-containing protein n=1 Tax=Campylobacter sp. MG1 TaxID=2976332 RepID=UPI00226CBE73|nr:NUDIX domain-containing protein [Campylobacter sp. MG1]
MKIEVSDFKLTNFSDSKFIKPKRVHYDLNGNLVEWDFIVLHDCVSVLLYHQAKDSYIFVKQFRAPLYYHEGLGDIENGLTVELCSGIVDKNKSYEEIAMEECIEELGIKPKKLDFLGKFYTGFGSGVSTQRLYFAIVSDDDIVGKGGGADSAEAIESVYVKIDEFEEFFSKNKKSALIEYAHLWFLNKKYKKI